MRPPSGITGVTLEHTIAAVCGTPAYAADTLERIQ